MQVPSLPLGQVFDRASYRGGEGAFEMVGGRALEVEVETTWKDLTHLDLEYQTLR